MSDDKPCPRCNMPQSVCDAQRPPPVPEAPALPEGQTYVCPACARPDGTPPDQGEWSIVRSEGGVLFAARWKNGNLHTSTPDLRALLLDLSERSR